MSAIVRVEKVLKKVPAMDQPENSLTILQDISFEVMPGESLAILGASGSGKSTLLGLIAGLDKPSSGEIFLDATPLSLLSEDEGAAIRKRLLGFVFQSFQLLPALDALENVMLPLELSGRLTDAKNLAKTWLSRVGLSHRLHHKPLLLSGGEQQRVAIARAFAPSPRLILADEPTGNLDVATGSQIIDLMFEINQQAHTTLILVTHDEAIAKRCQQVLHLKT